jgi:MFS family permease
MENETKTEYFTSDFRPMVKTLLFIGLAFFYLDFMIPVLSNIVFHIEGSELGLIFSIQTIGFMLSSPLAGYITDRWSKKKLVLIGATGRGIAYFVIYFAIYFASYVMLAIGTFILGFLVSFFWMPFNSLLSQKSHKDHRSTAFGQRSLWLGISIFVGSGIGLTYSGFMSTIFPNSPLLIFVPFIFYGISNIIGGLVFQKLVDESLVIQTLNNSDGNSKPNHDNQESKNESLPRFAWFGIGLLFFVRLLSATNGSIAQPYIIP